jgi:uncharacterized membrane protein YebE (DUF533 family)
MMGMLGKVAMGIMVAKTAGKLMGGSGGLGDMLGGLMGGNKGSSTSNNQGGMGDLLGNLMGNNTTQNNSGLGDLLGSALAGKDVDPTPSQEEQARIILKAMINAAKSDGNMDAEEQAKITQHIGEVTPEELEFVKNEMNSELDLQGVIDSAKGIEGEVYLASLMTINLDSQEEAQYLDGLARGLGISQQAANDFHQKVGAPKLYS